MRSTHYLVGFLTFQLAYNAQLHQLVTGCVESHLRVWNAESGKQLYHIASCHGQFAEMTALSIDHSGYRLATGASDGTVKVWDFGSGQELKSTTLPHARVTDEGNNVIGVFFCSVDGNRCIAAVGCPNHVYLFSVRSLD